MVRKIGYLAPEFPGQTHQFLWREIKALAELGVPSTLISTRRPDPGVVVHAWAKEAVAVTTYLFPLDARDAAEAGPSCSARVPLGSQSAWRSPPARPT